MRSLKDIIWVAGLIEGEGCFCLSNHNKTNRVYPRLQLEMTDEDIVLKARNILNPEGNINFKNRRQKKGRAKQKPSYVLNVTGSLAEQWMMTLYSLMGKRRQSKIRSIFDCLRAQPKPMTTKERVTLAIRAKQQKHQNLAPVVNW